ncbi:MAG: hypothetical protein IEMM0008_1372 [bacterium]|nr:MAG: hypothetical protein IEMM0008_1372 [bacterium]
MRKWFVEFLDEEDYEENVILLLENSFKMFSKSEEYMKLPVSLKEAAKYDLELFIDFSYNYLGTRPEEISIDELDELLFELFPRKLSYETESLIETLEVIKAFFIFMGKEGYHPNGKNLAHFIDENQSEIIKECENPDNFGVAKTIGSLAIKEGVDLNNENELSQFINEFNQRSFDERTRLLNMDDSTLPFGGKVPRNSPCPCGSGKKHKKCCGK